MNQIRKNRGRRFAGTSVAFAIAFALVVFIGELTVAPVAASQARTPKCFGHTATIVGTPGDDVINGTSGDDVIVALDGQDTIYANGGNDWICAGAGHDAIFAAPEVSTAFGGPGDDWFIAVGPGTRFYGNDGTDTISFADSPKPANVSLLHNYYFFWDPVTQDTTARTEVRNVEDIIGSPFDDALAGNWKPNYIDGAGGDDVLRGRSGQDWLHGNDGDDYLTGGNDDDALFGGPGFDIANFYDSAGPVVADLHLTQGSATGNGNDQLTSIEGAFGSIHDDEITGNDVRNRIDGRGGNDTITGLAGNDILSGGYGVDVIDGGAGFDRCLSAEARIRCERPR